MPRHFSAVNSQFSNDKLAHLFNDFRKPIATLLFVLILVFKGNRRNITKKKYYYGRQQMSWALNGMCGLYYPC